MATLSEKSSDFCTQMLDLALIPIQHRSYEICLKLVKDRGLNIMYVPIEILSQELCDIATDSDPTILKHLPDEFKTPEICEKVAGKYGMYLQFVAEKYKTFLLCTNAFRSNPASMKYIPEKYINPNMYSLAVKADWSILQMVPDEFKTYEMCMSALKDYSCINAIDHIPEVHRTSELWLKWLSIVFKHANVYLKRIPESIKTKEFYKKAIGISLVYLEEACEKYDVSEFDLQDMDGFEDFFENIPEKFKTPKLIEAYNETSMVDSEDYWARLLRNENYATYIFENIPEKYKTKRICELFVFHK